VTASAFPAGPRAGNDDGYFLDNDAALTGGAVVATTSGGGAIWYNPAGLGGNAHAKIDISASAFSLAIRHMPDLLVTQLETERLSSDMDDLELRSVPVALTYVRDLSKSASIGLGVFMPENDACSVTSTLSTQTFFTEFPDVPADFQQRVEIAWKRSAYAVGPGLGWEVLPGLRLGASLLVTLRFDDRHYLSLVEAHTAGTYEVQRQSLRQNDSGTTMVGARVAVGVQWQPHERFSLGLMVRSPEVSFYTWGRRSRLTDITPGLIEGAPGGLRHEEVSLDGGGFRQVMPWRFDLGVAYRFHEGWIAIEADIRTPLDDDALELSRDLTWNLRAGTTFRVSDAMSLGFGVFTDQVAGRTLEDIGSWAVNFYGIALGGTIETPMRLREGAERDVLVFSTTVAFRYALGVGQSVGNFLEVHASDNVGFQVTSQDVTVHEITLHIGSALVF
jgi:hypothetical protein